jgi:5-methylcytosine-specific restriction endonuclease McrA
MRDYDRTHFSDTALLRRADRRTARDRSSTASLLADLAEIDRRQIYRELGYSSMHVYCVERLRFSDDEAYKRIQAARAGQRFPALFHEIEHGRLQLTGVVLLAPHLTDENAAELITDAVDKKTRAIERELAGQFPETRPRSSATVIRAIPTKSVELVARPVEEQVPDLLAEPIAAPVATAVPPANPHSPKRFLLKVEIDEEAHDRLREVQELLGHSVPSGDVAQVLARALRHYAAHLKRKRFGATDRPRRAKPSASLRHVPADVKRAVTERDRGQCTFVSAAGQRCGSRKLLEFDHVDPVARGGKTTVDNMRLRCRAHNQLEAERIFGAECMRQKRAEARLQRADQDEARRVPSGARSP